MAEESDPIATEWARLLSEWDDPDAHKRFLTLADGLDRLAEAGTRYRAVKDDDPARREVAEAQIERLLTLALAKLTVLKTERQPRRFKAVMTLLAATVSGAIILWTLLGLMRSF